MVNLGPFWTMWEAPWRLKVGGLRPPTFSGTYTRHLRTFFSFFYLKKLVFQGLDFVFRSFFNPITICMRQAGLALNTVQRSENGVQCSDVQTRVHI